MLTYGMYRTTHSFLILLLASCLAATSNLAAEVTTSQLPVLTGTDVITIESKTVADDFVLYVRLPPEAATEPDRTFPVIYAVDGDHTFPMLASITTQLGWSGAVPPSIIVGIGYGTLDLENGNHRDRDLSPQPFAGSEHSGGGEKFHSFLTSEVIPYIESQYPAASEERYFYGHSLGGLFALYTYIKSPEYFQGIVAGSPLLAGQLDLLTQLADTTPARDCKLFIATGDEEDATLFIDDLERLDNLLETTWAAEASYEMELIKGFDHFTMLAPAMSKGLKSIFANPSKP